MCKGNPIHPFRLKLFTISVFIFLTGTRAYSQNLLNFTESSTQSLNTLSFNLDPKKLKQVHVTRGAKFPIKIDSLHLNATSYPVEFIRIRGTSSSQLDRKSFNIHLLKKARFFEYDQYKVDKLYAISMNMDRNYIRNVLSYIILSGQGILISPYTYVNLLANQQSEGIYLAVYPPADYALKELKASVVIRRGYNSSAEKIYDKNSTSEEVKAITQQYQSIYKKILPAYTGEELYQQLSSLIQLDHYFTWMAFNHLFQNGDYADEVYFVWDETQKQFDIIPWDFDDLLQLKPHDAHPGIVNKPFIFSTEDKLDATIAEDPFLYRKYLETYRQLLDKFSVDDLRQALETCFVRVQPYFDKPEVIAQSKYDQYGQTDRANLEKDLTNIYRSISARMNQIRTDLNAALK
jgi:hypothetical protein